MPTLASNTKPIEVWLSQPNIEITCRVIYDDESADEFDVKSLSLRGAEREMTAWLITQGYEPAGRWTAGNADTISSQRIVQVLTGDREVMRTFRKTKAS